MKLEHYASTMEESTSPVAASSVSSEPFSSRDAQDAVRALLISDGSNVQQKKSTHNKNLRMEADGGVTKTSGLKNYRSSGISALRAIWRFCTKSDLRNRNTLIKVYQAVQNYFSCIPRDVDVTDHLTEEKKPCAFH